MPRPDLKEVTRDHHGMSAAKTGQKFADTLLHNPDSVMRVRGGTNFEIYDELLRDDQVKATFQQRRSAVTSCEWMVDSASEDAQDVAAADHLREQIKRLPWDVITDRMMYGLFYGYAVAEMMWAPVDGKIEIADILVRNRDRFKFNINNDLRLCDEQSPLGRALSDNKFWLFQSGASHNDNPYGQGLGHALYWPVFFKRSDIKFWLVFLEKFGMPTTVARLPGQQIDDPAAKVRALEALEAIQHDATVVIPEDTIIELIEAARSGTADYRELSDRMDKAISKIVMSQTMTTDDGSSRSQAEVHKGVGDTVIKSDSDLLSESFNRGPATWLTAWNFPSAQPPRVWRKTEPPADLLQTAERDTKIYQLGFEPTEDYIAETYGPGWRKAAVPEVTSNIASNPQEPLPAEFLEVSGLTQAKASHRADQQQLKDAAELLATQYEGIYGQRIEQIVSYLEETDDIETFKRQLTSMLTDQPAQGAVDKVRNATWAARLMGALKGQR
jgi:phage gp29-like protein